MFASKYFLSLLAFGALAVSASPVELKKRTDVSDVLGVIGTLQSSTSTILPQIENLVSSGSATALSVTPLIGELVNSLETASTSLATLGSVDTTTGGSETDVANAIAPIVSDIATTLNNLDAAVPGLLGGLLGGLGLDAALNQVLTGLETLLSGVLNLVAQLLVDVAGLLRSLALVLTLGSLGL